MTTGYFIDFIGKDKTFNWIKKTNTKVFMANMTNTGSKKWRDEWTKKGYVIGMFSELALTPKNHEEKPDTKTPYYDIAWNYTAELAQKSTWKKLSDTEKAKKILGFGDSKNGALLYPAVQLSASESKPSKKGGYCFWAQDLEASATVQANSAQAKAQFAGIIAVLWAGRKLLGDKFSIIPVVSKSVLTNLHVNSKDKFDGELANLNEVMDMVKILTPNWVTPKTKAPAGSHKRTSWNFMSLLKQNSLIDGFTYEQYSDKARNGQPLTIPASAAPFEPNTDLSYSLMGNWDMNLPQKSSLAKPIKTNYYGNLPTQANVYFPSVSDQTAAEQLEPNKYFKPTRQHVIAHNASIPQYLDGGTRVIDLTTLTQESSVELTIHLSREALYDSQSGFYRVVDHEGSVRDSITGEIHTTDSKLYEQVALQSSNQIGSVGSLALKGDSTDQKAIELGGGLMMAPFTKVLEKGKEETFFAFAEANADGISHFKQLAPNQFGMEDIKGGGDRDYNDLIIGFQFLEVV